MTAAALLREAAAVLREAGVPSPEWDAERLLRHVTGWDRAFLVTRPDEPVEGGAEARFRGLLTRRAARVPLQHLVGTQAFWRHEFVVTPAVLIPRPETEVLVETALELARAVERPVVVDVGTGSGCVALSIAAERPDAVVHATDVSEAALAVARDNARRLGLDGRVALHRGDLLEPVRDLAGRIDLVVSNPPYVDEADRDSLAPEVRDHEPAVALFAPGDALSVYRRLAVAAATALKPGGCLAVEVGAGQAESVVGILGDAGLEPGPPVPDLQAIARVVFGSRSRLSSPGTHVARAAADGRP
jgi:release factor glutamine methyltransferase